MSVTRSDASRSLMRFFVRAALPRRVRRHYYVRGQPLRAVVRRPALRLNGAAGVSRGVSQCGRLAIVRPQQDGHLGVEGLRFAEGALVVGSLLGQHSEKSMSGLCLSG